MSTRKQPANFPPAKGATHLGSDRGHTRAGGIPISANADRVSESVAAWAAQDADRIMGFFSEGAVYTNMPIDPPNEGLEAIRKAIEGFLGMAQKIEFVVAHTAESDRGVVMNERIDRFLIGEKWVEAPVMGVFEIADGRLEAWRDCFDLASFQKAVA